MAGLTPAGFVAKTVAEIITDLQTKQASTVDPTLNTSSTGLIANLNMSFAMELAQVWELAAEIYDAHDPETAEGVALDANGSLAGITRLPATKAKTVLRLVLDPSTLVPTGSVVSDPLRPTTRFVTTADGLAVSALPGPYNVNVTAEAESTGALTAASNSLTKIESPVSGWLSVSNPDIATPGTDAETDEAYRARQLALKTTTEGSTVAGITADVGLLPDVITAKGYENTTDATVGLLPPHTFEIVVSGGDASQIAASIWSNKPAGIDSFGTSSAAVLDSEGVTRTVRFSRPVTKIVNVTYTATTDGSYVAHGIRDALVLASVSPSSPAHFEVGTPVYLVRMLAVASKVQGVVNCTLDIEFAPTVPADAIPTSPDKTLAINAREVATFDGATWSGP